MTEGVKVYATKAGYWFAGCGKAHAILSERVNENLPKNSRISMQERSGNKPQLTMLPIFAVCSFHLKCWPTSRIEI